MLGALVKSIVPTPNLRERLGKDKWYPQLVNQFPARGVTKVCWIIGKT